MGDGPKIKGFRLLIRAVNAPLRRRKTAHVIPFPSNRRGAFIRKQADTMAKMTAETGDANLRSQLAIQGDSMRRKGIDDLRTDSSTCRRCTACVHGRSASAPASSNISCFLPECGVAVRQGLRLLRIKLRRILAIPPYHVLLPRMGLVIKALAHRDPARLMTVPGVGRPS